MRLYSIMEDLTSQHGYLSLQCLVDKYKVSKRTMQNDLSYLSLVSHSKGYYLKYRKGYGYIVEIIDNQKFDAFLTTLQNTSETKATERIINIAYELVLKNEYQSIDQLVEKIGVSSSTIKKDLKLLPSILIEYKLNIESKRHWGIRIVGAERDKRKFIFKKYNSDNSYIDKDIKCKLGSDNKISTLLVSQIENENLTINYTELKALISNIEVIVVFAMNNVVNEHVRESVTLDTAIDKISFNLEKMIKECYKVDLDGESISEIKIALKQNLRSKDAEFSFGNGLGNDINDFLKDVDTTYNTHFNSDEEFKNALINHVQLLVERLSNKISYQNVLIKEICARYPMIFNISIKFSELLKNKYGVEVTQDEAGFIATHFATHMERERQKNIERFDRIAVVCSSGGGCAVLIKTQIGSLFKRATIETFSFVQEREIKQFDPNLIFTIMPLKEKYSVPIIYIKELLGDIDLARIKQALQYEKCDSFDLSNDSYLYSIFNKEFFQYIDAQDYIKLITMMARQIEESGFGGSHYTEYVLERENYMSTIYLNGICIAHPINICADRNVVSVTILKKPIVYQDKEAKIIFMVSLKKEDNYIHKLLSEKLFKLMNSKKHIQRILDNHTYEDLIVTLKELDGGDF